MNKLKISNFHTHTFLCHHATGRPIDYVKVAKEQGCSELGFSDHCPYPDLKEINWINCRMSVDQVEQYKNDVQEAAENADFKVHFGFECEYDRNYLSWYRDELKGRYGAEYLVFGPHWVVDGNIHPYAPQFNHDKRLLAKYTDQVVEGIGSGLYSILAHPDLFMSGWREWDDEAKACLTAILNAAKDMDLPLEVNGLGIYRGFVETSKGPRLGYPYHEFWEMVASSGARVICDSDAHNPNDVIAHALNSRNFAKKYGIVPIETIFS